MSTVRWNIAVSPEVDQSVRLFLAAQGGGRKGDLSRFIEEAVRAHACRVLRRGLALSLQALGASAWARLPWAMKKPLRICRSGAASFGVWCPEEDSNLHASRR